MMNFIPYNSNEGLGFARPSWQRASEMAGRLHQCGILSRLRNSAGQDIDGGCGQLRARAAVLKSEKTPADRSLYPSV
jgi:23S rRNA (adenine2503-C2)-methyltransferase